MHYETCIDHAKLHFAQLYEVEYNVSGYKIGFTMLWFMTGYWFSSE